MGDLFIQTASYMEQQLWCFPQSGNTTTKKTVVLTLLLSSLPMKWTSNVQINQE